MAFRLSFCYTRFAAEVSNSIMEYIVDKTDEELVRAYREGEEEPLSILIARYLRAIYHFTYRYTRDVADAEDVTQEVFVKVWKNLRSYDDQIPFRNWIFSIAKNAAIDWMRRKRPLSFSELERETGADVGELFADAAPLPDEILARKKSGAMLREAVEKLPVTTQPVLRLRYDEDLTFREIADRLEKPLNTIKSQHRRALGFLKKLLG